MPQPQSAEDRLIAQYFRPLATHPGALALTDDAALLSPAADQEIVITADAIVGGVHFFPEDAADMVAKKALRVNLSDLAAKGAKPAGFVLTLSLPASVSDSWVDLFARGLGSDSEAYACPLLGGDSTRTTGPVVITITAFGTVPRGTMVRRSGARAGDAVAVTGSIGDAALGLGLRKAPESARRWKLANNHQYHLIRRYLLPQPRNAVAEALRTHATAAMDVSDGLAGDLAKLCEASGVSADVQVGRVPLSEAGQGIIAADPSAIERVLTGGDDYEIVCTMPSENLHAFRVAAASVSPPVPVTEIGRIVASKAPPRFLGTDGQPLTFKHASYSHF